jgi:hypothetical protein
MLLGNVRKSWRLVFSLFFGIWIGFLMGVGVESKIWMVYSNFWLIFGELDRDLMVFGVDLKILNQRSCVNLFQVTIFDGLTILKHKSVCIFKPASEIMPHITFFVI